MDRDGMLVKKGADGAANKVSMMLKASTNLASRVETWSWGSCGGRGVKTDMTELVAEEAE